jgi:DNA-binding beta-propeller fold protein YncE
MAMKLLTLFLSFLFVTLGCQSTSTSNKIIADSFTYERKKPPVNKKDTLVPPKPYSELIYDKEEKLPAAPGTKSVLFNAAGDRLYAMNLEGMSVYEFDQPSRQITREFKFKPSKGTGWDYVKEKPISSFQEKPVEACLSHDDKILWVSLHNAEGIVPIRVDSLQANHHDGKVTGQPVKKITVIFPGTDKKDSFDVPLIKTGKTPKVISRTGDSKYLLVSNWHSHTVSVLELNKDLYPFGKVIDTIPVSAIPRGIAVDNKTNRSYVAIMGGASITVIDNAVWLKVDELNVASNPRHIVLDTSGHLFVSYNSLGKVACLDAQTGKTLFTADTHDQPRTITLSKNHQFLFVTCYSGDMVDVFKINKNDFTKVTSLSCKGHPVGVDVFENDEKLEAWVCSYSTGSISVFSFKKE